MSMSGGYIEDDWQISRRIGGYEQNKKHKETDRDKYRSTKIIDRGERLLLKQEGARERRKLTWLVS